MQGVEPLEVQAAAIHHVVGAWFGDEQLQHIDIVELAVRDMDEGGNGSVQVEQGAA